MHNRQKDHDASAVRRSRHVLRPLPLSGKVQGLVLSQRFSADNNAAYSAALLCLLTLIEPALSSLKCEAFVQVTETGRFGSAAIRELGASMDDYGLGIYPEMEPPRTWNRSDFERMTLNDKMPPLFFEIMRASSARIGAIAAVREKFLGTGSYSEAYCPPTVDFYGRATALFKPQIKNRTARMFPYHAPILRRRAVEVASSTDLEWWMCGSQLYVRETLEEDGVLLLYRKETEAIISQAMNKNEELTEFEFLI